MNASAAGRALPTLKDNADIEDNRLEFYQQIENIKNQKGKIYNFAFFYGV